MFNPTIHACRIAAAPWHDADHREAQAAIDRLAAIPITHRLGEEGTASSALRPLMAQSHGDEEAYRDYRDRYRAMATSLEVRGTHMRWTEAMP